MISKCEFFGGYPITPSSEIMHVLSSKLPAIGGVCMQMEDEISGICATLWCSYEWKKSYDSSVDLKLAESKLGLGYISEVPLVVVNVMRRRSLQLDFLQELHKVIFFTQKIQAHGDVKSIT